jgi:hypothetical protein
LCVFIGVATNDDNVESSSGKTLQNEVGQTDNIDTDLIENEIAINEIVNVQPIKAVKNNYTTKNNAVKNTITDAPDDESELQLHLQEITGYFQNITMPEPPIEEVPTEIMQYINTCLTGI